VRQQDQHGRDSGPPVPDRDPVEPPERALDAGQKRREHERAREELDRLGAEDLSEVTAGGLARRPREEPEQGVADRRGYDGDGAGCEREVAREALHSCRE